MELQFVDPSNADAFIDFRRFVLLFAHRFSDRIRFVSELEVEHALVEGGEDKGELELEQAYLDFLIDRRFSIRAGQLLVPVGIINERHEPPVYYGVHRPFVDTFIIPTTWFDVGAGVFGDVGKGWRYRAYVMPPLNAAEFSAAEGLADSSQNGSRSVVRHWAGTGRVEYLGVPRLTLGASIWNGRSATGSRNLDPRVTLIEADGRGRVGRLELRGEYAQVFIDQADELNRLRALREGVDPNIASQMVGFYAEAAHPILPYPSPREVVGFVRYEKFDTQYRMPSRLPADRRVQGFGLDRRHFVLPRSRCRRQSRLHRERQRQRGCCGPEGVQRGARLVVLRRRVPMRRLTIAAVLIVGMATCPFAQGQTVTVRVTAERFRFSPDANQNSLR